MKKLFVVLILISNSTLSQNLGFNGAGLFENYDPQVLQWLHDINAPFTIRVPGGSISKFHDPYSNRQGWGMSEQNIINWYKNSGFDEDGQGQDKWIGKSNEQPNHSYMDDLIKMQKEFPNMQVLYVLNVLNSSADANLNAIRYMIKGGVNIVGVEGGNEVYGKYKSFNEYILDFEPIFNALDMEFPTIKKGLVAGANLSRKELVSWNDQMAKYKGKYDAVILHYYYTARELKTAYEAVPQKMTYDQNILNSKLNDAFKTAFQELMDKKLLEDGIAYAQDKFQGKKIWITEWNTKPAQKLNNTLVNGAWQFKEMVELRNSVEYLLIHNGVSPDVYGMICRSNKFDSEQTSMVRRMGYWAFLLAGEIDTAKKLTKNGLNKITSIDDADCFYFMNMDEAYTPSFDYNGYKVISATIHYVSGKFTYSSSGQTGFMAKGQKPSYEVNGIKVENFTGNVPKNAFGYIEFDLQ